MTRAKLGRYAAGVRVAAYVYPGWHPIPERDFTEWPFVEGCRPRFAGHVQPRIPALGPYDDRDPDAVAARVQLALDHGVDALTYGFFWCRGKRVFQDALDLGFLGSDLGRCTPFALMWAYGLPRRVLPVRRADLPVISGDRLVHSDVEDFVALIEYVATRYFTRPNYVTVGGKAYFAIFDATFFVRELGLEPAAAAIRRARAALADLGVPGLHLAAIDPNKDVIGALREVGFDSVTHYVFLPDWKGPREQDYVHCASKRAEQWQAIARAARLPYMPETRVFALSGSTLESTVDSSESTAASRSIRARRNREEWLQARSSVDSRLWTLDSRVSPERRKPS